MTHEVLTERVAAALGLGTEFYAQDPDVRFIAKDETDRALRDLLGYRLYRDLERGWRVTAPNLEQTGLLEIRYRSLDDLVAAEDVWSSLHPALALADPSKRRGAAIVLLDSMRRSLAIQVEYLTPNWQSQLRLRSTQYLLPPWAIEEEEKLEVAKIVYPRSERPTDYGGNRYISGRSGIGQYVAGELSLPGQPTPEGRGARDCHPGSAGSPAGRGVGRSRRGAVQVRRSWWVPARGGRHPLGGPATRGSRPIPRPAARPASA